MRTRSVIATALVAATITAPAPASPPSAESVARALAQGDAGNRKRALGLLRAASIDERIALVPRFAAMAAQKDEALQLGSLRALRALGPSADSAFETVVLIGSGARGSLRAAAALAGLAIHPDGSGLVPIVHSAVLARGPEGLEVMKGLSLLDPIPQDYMKTVYWALTAPSAAMRVAAIRSVPRLFPPIASPPEALKVAALSSLSEERAAALETLKQWASDPNIRRLTSPGMRRGSTDSPPKPVRRGLTINFVGTSDRADCESSPSHAARVASKLSSKQPGEAVAAASDLFLCGRNAVPALVKTAGASDTDARTYSLIVLKALSERRHHLSIPDLGPEIWSGIGADIDAVRRPLTLDKIHPGSPAEAAGLEPHDILDAIDGRPTKPMSGEEIIRRLRGPAGSTVTLSVRRFDVPEGMILTVRRARMSKERPRPEVSLDVLQRLGPYVEAAIPALRGLLDSTDAAVRETARLALQEGQNEKLRWAAIMGESPRHPDGPVHPEGVVLTKMADSDPMVRLDGIIAAGRLPPSVALIEALRRALLDPANIFPIKGRPDLFAVPTLRHAAMLSLLSFGAAAKTAVPDIAQAVKVGDEAMAELAFKALAKLGLGIAPGAKTPAYIHDLLRRAEGPRLELLRPVAPEVVGPLLDAAVSGERLAVEKLARLCPEAGEVLAAALGARSPKRRFLASDALARAVRLPASAAAPLIDALKDENVTVRVNAALAMFHLPARSGTEVLAALEEAENDQDYRVRAAAASSRAALELAAEKDSGGLE